MTIRTKQMNEKDTTRICSQQSHFTRYMKGSSSSLLQEIPDCNANPSEKAKNTGKDNYAIIKDSANAYLIFFLLLGDLKTNYITQYVYNYITEHIVYETIIYFSILAQKRQVEARKYQAKK